MSKSGHIWRLIYTREIGDLVDILNVSVKRLEKFALNAILITRLKTKQFEIKKDEIHLSSLINEVLNEEKDKFQCRKIKVTIKDELPEGLIPGEPELIKKCVDNILDNAIAFSPQDGNININTYAEGHNIICEFKDHGKGFETGVIENAFKLFTTGREYHDNCTGIGLPIVKMIMEAHGGSIIIGNNPGGGASVKLLFKNGLES